MPRGGARPGAGRPRKPDTRLNRVLKQQPGSKLDFDGCIDNDDEPIPMRRTVDLGPVEKPEWMVKPKPELVELTQLANEYWDSVAPELERVGALDAISVFPFQHMCLCYAKYRMTERNAWFRLWMAYAGDFGLTPKSRNFKSLEQYWGEKFGTSRSLKNPLALAL
jgi:hypothetical protein